MLDEIGRSLEIQRLREMVSLKLLRGEGKLKEKETQTQFEIIDSEIDTPIAVVFFDLRGCKWRTKVIGEPTKPRPIKRNFIHMMNKNTAEEGEFFDEDNYGRALAAYEKSFESILPLVERPKTKVVKAIEE